MADTTSAILADAYQRSAIYFVVPVPSSIAAHSGVWTAEMEAGENPVPDLQVQALARLSGAVDMFAGQADAVLAMMLENDASDDLLASAEALVDFFQDAKAQIAFLLRLDQDNG